MSTTHVCEQAKKTTLVSGGNIIGVHRGIPLNAKLAKLNSFCIEFKLFTIYNRKSCASTLSGALHGQVKFHSENAVDLLIVISVGFEP